ncbi:hypothetical protein ACF1BE_34025 [Streptomyces sp. NPDC014991]|uniref:hypothetical protein n=1 Tax=Streptomyces sp. NPDC014991 TaxID=3364935 RepID=UPI0036FE0394
MELDPPLAVTLDRLEILLQERGLQRSELLDYKNLSARTALPEDTVRALLNGLEPPPDSVNERVRARVKALADAHLVRTGRRMSDLAGNISQQLGVSAFWARQVCSGEKVPSVEFLHGLVSFFQVEGGEAFFTSPASEALNRVLLPMVAMLQQTTESDAATDSLAARLSGYDDVRGVALRQAHNLPQERWNVLNATLRALLELDDTEADQ